MKERGGGRRRRKEEVEEEEDNVEGVEGRLELKLRLCSGLQPFF